MIRETEGLQNLAGEWRSLLARVPLATPFQTPEFQLAWWEHLGGGEWEKGDLYCLAGRGSDGELAGVAPLFLPGGRSAQGQLLLLGSHEIADYLDFIAPPETQADFIRSAFEHLDGDQSIPWDYLDLYNLPDNSPSLPIMEEAAKGLDWGWQLEPLQQAPAIPLPESWDAYLSKLSKKKRHEVRRKLRRAVGYIPPAELSRAASAEEIHAALETLFDLMRENDQKRSFLTDSMQEQLGAIVEAGREHGWLQLSELRFGQETAAVELNFDYGGTVWAYNSGSRADYRELSPGVVLHALLIQEAIAQEREGYDFMRGDEEYKFRLGGQSKQVMRATIHRTAHE